MENNEVYADDNTVGFAQTTSYLKEEKKKKESDNEYFYYYKNNDDVSSNPDEDVENAEDFSESSLNKKHKGFF